MDLTVTVVHTLAPELLALLAAARASRAQAPAPAVPTPAPVTPQAPVTGNDLAPAAPVTMKRRGRPPSNPQPQPTGPVVATTTVAPAQPVPTPPESTPRGPSRQEIKDMVSLALDAMGEEEVKKVFDKFKAKKFSDLDPERYSDFARALLEARELHAKEGLTS